MDSLTPEQAAKLARLWVWCEGHAYTDSLGRVCRVSLDLLPYLLEGRTGGRVPDLRDNVTRDGLLRTARAAWQNPRLHAQPLWDFDEPDKIARWDIHGAPRCAGKTEDAALLAAILAAPEAT